MRESPFSSVVHWRTRGTHLSCTTSASSHGLLRAMVCLVKTWSSRLIGRWSRADVANFRPIPGQWLRSCALLYGRGQASPHRFGGWLRAGRRRRDGRPTERVARDDAARSVRGLRKLDGGAGRHEPAAAAPLSCRLRAAENALPERSGCRERLTWWQQHMVSYRCQIA